MRNLDFDIVTSIFNARHKGGSSIDEITRCYGIDRATAFSVIRKETPPPPEVHKDPPPPKEKANVKNKSTIWQYPPVHPAAEKLPLMSDSEIDALAADIKKDMTLYQPIIIWVDNRAAANGAEGPFPEYTLDGRNRIEAMRRLGYTDPRDVYCPYPGLSGKCVRYVKAICKVGTAAPDLSKITEHWQPDVDPELYVLSANVYRRHLTPEQRRDAIARYIKLDPTASDRKVARTLNVGHPLVAEVRQEASENGRIFQNPIPQTTSENAQNAHNPKSHLPLERAKAAILANPTISKCTALAKIANTSDKTIAKARRELVEAKEMSTPAESKAEVKPEVELLRKAFEELDAPLPIFKKWVLEIHKLNVTPALLRGYLNELE